MVFTLKNVQGLYLKSQEHDNTYKWTRELKDVMTFPSYISAKKYANEHFKTPPIVVALNH